jgi:hypothetical protein
MKTVGYVAAAVFIFVLGDIYGVDGAVNAITEGLVFLKGALSSSVG